MADRDFETPEYRDWRYRATAINGGTLVPNRIGVKFTPAEIAALAAWAESQGLLVVTRKPTGIHVLDNDNRRERLDLNSYGAPGLKADRAAQRQQAYLDRIEAQRQDDRDAFAAAASRSFILATFGEDFTNAYNKRRLADYLDGKTEKFTGLMSWKWVDGFKALGLDPEGQRVDEVLRWLKKRYEETAHGDR
jgi:hypothetical protein